MGKRSAHVCLPSGLWRCLGSSANVPSSEGNEGLAVGLFLRLGNVLERQGLVGKKQGGHASIGDWIFQQVFVNLPSTSTAKAVSLKTSF